MVVVGRAAPKQSERIAWRLSEEDWASVLREWGYPAYYSKLIWKWLWQKGLADPTVYTDLPKALREKLLHAYEWPLLKLITSRESQDGTDRKSVV